MRFSTLGTLEELRERLCIEPVNTGRQIDMCGVVSDDVESLHAYSNEKGQIEFASGIEFPSFLYRGQPQEWLPCLSGIGRLREIAEKLRAFSRTVAFEELVATHPLVEWISREVRFLGASLSVNVGGIAQHYGLPTDMLDLTSNFDVATFFACCHYDRRHGYYPVRASVEPGVIYRANSLLLDIPEASGGYSPTETIGFQLFPRPMEQRAFAIRLQRGKHFDRHPQVQRILFRHNRKIAQKIFDKFDGGAKLFPPDPIVEHAKIAEELFRFTRNQLDSAWVRLEAWEGRCFHGSERREVEERADLVEVDTPALQLVGKHFALSESETARIRAVLNQSRYRRAAYLCDFNPDPGS